jgi:hypothetical protein
MSQRDEDIYQLNCLKNLRKFDPLTKLRQSHIPIASERDELHSLLRDAERDIGRIDDELARLHGLISSLENGKEELYDAMCLSQSLLSPIRRICDDVLSEILLWSNTQITITDQHVKIPAISLSKVCSSWRRLVADRMIFWSDVCIRIQNGDPSSSQQNLISKVFDRSGTAKLNLKIRLSDKVTTAFVSVLQTHSDRWNVLELECLPEFIIQCFRTVSVFPSLTHANLEVRFTRNVALPAPDGVLTVQAPRLRSFTLLKRSGKYDKLQVEIPWAQMKQISLGVTGMAEFFDALRQCSALEEAELSFTYRATPVSGPFEPVLSNISTLSMQIIDGCEHEAIASCFRTLATPALTTLRVWAEPGGVAHYEPEWHISDFASFITRSGCALSTLILQDICISDSTIISVLGLVSTLTHLKIQEPYLKLFKYQDSESKDYKISAITDSLLQFLQIKSMKSFYRSSVSTTTAYTPSLPHLEVLDLDGKGAEDKLSIAAFKKMLWSRWRCGESKSDSRASLKSVRLCVWDQSITDGHRSEFTALQRLGMRVDVSTCATKASK